jgi:uncharacterized protein YggE
MKKLLVVLLAFCAFNIYAKDDDKYIDVSGTAIVKIPADIIFFNLQVKYVTQTIAESKKQVDSSIARLMIILKKYRIKEDDISQSPIILGKNYEYNDNKRVMTGYFASSDISFYLSDLTKYLDLSNELAANQEIEVVSSGYSVSDLEKYSFEAYEKALKAAEKKAAFMCNTLGVKTGKILQIDENTRWGGSPVVNSVEMFKSDGAEAGQPISGKVSITRTVNVRYEIEQKK